MKKHLISIAGAIIGAVTFVHSSVFAQEVPKLKQGMSYSEARETLINEGWQAIEIPILQRGDLLSLICYFRENKLS